MVLISKVLHYVYRIYNNYYSLKHPKKIAEKIFYNRFHRGINWNDPKDLNEKINWLKFHVNQKEWAILADKYLVRDYVKERGQENILVPLLGCWYDVDHAIEEIKELDGRFILKSNNGCGHVKIINAEDLKNEKAIGDLRKELQKWMSEKNYGITSAELHYQYIKNCILAEELLENTNLEISKSLIDYKIWCFDGKPYGCLVVYDRDSEDHSYKLDYYDLNWVQHTEYLSEVENHEPIEKPLNWDRMLKIAEILSKGHPQVRVDLYNINGKIYFGELTFTSLGGYMTYFTQEHLQTMGRQVTLDLKQESNELFK